MKCETSHVTKTTGTNHDQDHESKTKLRNTFQTFYLALNNRAQLPSSDSISFQYSNKKTFDSVFGSALQAV